MMPGVPERRTDSYVRHGTTTLFAALDVTSGFVIGRVWITILPTRRPKSDGSRDLRALMRQKIAPHQLNRTLGMRL
jgi:hypothetical protein